MNVLKKLLGYPLLAFGSLFLLLLLLLPFSDRPRSDKSSAALGLLIMGLPSTVAGGLLVRSANTRRLPAQTPQALEAEQDRLQRVLYQLIKSNNGQVTLVQFALAADIPADEARVYLDAQSVAFSANFDVTDSGSIVYQFPIS